MSSAPPLARVGGPPGQVRPVQGQLVGTLAGVPQREAVVGTGEHPVVEVDRLEDGDEFVEAVRAQRPDAEVQVHLRGDLDTDGGGKTHRAMLPGRC